MERYISIVVPYFNRPHYLRELIDSIHKYADMPFELIVHDDVSTDGSTPEVFNMRDKMSSLIINQGHNLGISVSTNRLINMASSEYIIFLNDDCVFVNSCLNNIYDIISRPYVGFLHLTQANRPDLNLKETKFDITGIKSGCALAFRKNVWREIGGWNEHFISGGADVAFMTTIFKWGYFAVAPYGKEYAINTSYIKYNNTDSSIGKSGYDCSYPKIFNTKEKGYDEWCKAREGECYKITNTLNRNESTIGNIDYWHNYMKRLGEKSGNTISEKIDWEFGKLHGHDKWKDQISNEIALVH